MDSNPEHDGEVEGARDDVWPDDQIDRMLLVLALDQLHRRRLRGIEPDPMRRQQIVDRASDRLMARLAHRPPQRPRAWYSKVVGNLWRSGKHLPRRARVTLQTDASYPATAASVPSSPAWSVASHRTWLRRVVLPTRGLLTARQQGILAASIAAGATHASAARSLGQSRRDFGRALAAVGAKIRKALAARTIPPPPL